MLNIIVGGTSESPITADCAAVAVVKAAEIATSGSVLGNLALNFLAGAIDPALAGKDGLSVFPSALKNDKSAAKFLLDVSAEKIREGWAAYQAERKRYSAPTLQALVKGVKLLTKEPKEQKKTFKEQVTEIIAGKGTPASKIKAIEALLNS